MEGDWLEAGLALEGVTFDEVLRVGGRFMAGMAKHRSAEPDSLGVRVGEEEFFFFGRDRVGFTEKTLVKSRDKMKPRTTYEPGVPSWLTCC